MVSQEEYERVQSLLGGRRGPTPHKREFAFTGLIRCGECGCQITAEEKCQVICSDCKTKFASLNRDSCPKCDVAVAKMRNPTVLRYVYYHCTKKKPGVRCSERSVEIRRLEAQIEEYLASIQINERYLEWAIRHLRKMHKQEATTQDALLHSQHKAAREVAKKLNRLLEMRLADEVSEEEYRAKKADLEREKARYEELLRDGSNRQDAWLRVSEETFRFARTARRLFAEGDLRAKREIVATLGSNLILKDGKLRIDAPKPFFVIKEGLRAVPEAKEGFEPAKNAMSKGGAVAPCDPNPHWLPGRDSNPDSWDQNPESYR